MLLFRHHVLRNPSGGVCLKTYNYHEVFEEVDKHLSEKPALRLYALSQLRPTLQKALRSVPTSLISWTGYKAMTLQ
jgi:hypothetical protein